MKQTLKRVGAFGSALALSVSSLAVLAVPSVHAAADTCTWTGSGGDDNISTAANWSGCDNATVPENGDILYFPDLGTDETVNNDIVSLSLAGMQFDADHADYYDGEYTLTGNDITLTGNISEQGTSSGYTSHTHVFQVGITLGAAASFNAGSNNRLQFDSTVSLDLSTYDLTIASPVTVLGTIVGSGGIILDSGGSLSVNGDNSVYTGSITVNSGGSLSNTSSSTVAVEDMFGAVSSSITVADGGRLTLDFGDTLGATQTFAKPITINGSTGSSNYSDLSVNDEYNGAALDITLSAVTLGSDIEVDTNFYNRDSVLNLTTTGAFSVARRAASTGKLMVNDEEKFAERVEYYVGSTDSNPAIPVTVGSMYKYIINGVRGDVTISADGVLAGNGTVGAVTAESYGILSPGASPGCLNTGNMTLNINSTYEVELAGTTVCGQYDSTNVTGTVSLGLAELSLVHLYGFTPANGTVFTLISNDGTDTVTGEFNNLAQDETVVVDGVTYRIAYNGGDGNDVTLTVTGLTPEAQARANAQGNTETATPGTPDTGFGAMLTNPATVMFSTTAIAGAILAIARKYSLLKG